MVEAQGNALRFVAAGTVRSDEKLDLAMRLRQLHDGLVAILSTQSDFEVAAVAEDGQEAVELVAKLRPDVILLDLEMPGMDGLEALLQLRNDAPEINVLVFTAFDTDERIVGAPSHIDTWDPKPDAPAEIRGEFAPISTAVPATPAATRPSHSLPVVRDTTRTLRTPSSCNHCHQPGQWASDDKPTKNIARRMWTMRAEWQEEVRTASGNPDAVVTCYTCHKGQPKPAFAPDPAERK